MPLKPGEKKMAFMVITTPKINAKRERVSVKLSENLNEKEMGGIIFNAQGADQKLVLNKSMKRINNLFRMLKKEFKIKSADSIITLSGKNLEKELNLRSLSVSMKKLADLESGTLTEMSKLMAQKEFSKYKSAIVETAKSAEKRDLSLIRESQDRLIYSTIPLFLKNKKISGF